MGVVVAVTGLHVSRRLAMLIDVIAIMVSITAIAARDCKGCQHH
jgi:hypothetical protein